MIRFYSGEGVQGASFSSDPGQQGDEAGRFQDLVTKTAARQPHQPYQVLARPLTDRAAP
jgi:hypothetical protein